MANILELKNEQRLRILPFDKTYLFKVYNYYHVDDRCFVLDTDTNITFTDRLSRQTRNFYLVEYGGELRIVKTGMRIRHLINEYFSDDTGQSFYAPQHLIDCYVGLTPVISFVSGFQNYDASQVYQVGGDMKTNIELMIHLKQMVISWMMPKVNS